MVSHARTLLRMLRHAQVARSTAGLIVMGVALALGLTAGSSALPSAGSLVPPAITPLPAVASQGGTPTTNTGLSTAPGPNSTARLAAPRRSDSPAAVATKARRSAVQPSCSCCSLPSRAVATREAGTPASTTGSTAVISPEPAGTGLDVTARLLDGTEFRLGQQRGRVVAIFTVTTGACGACIPHTQAWAEVSARYRPQDLVVLALVIGPLDTPEQVAAFRAMFGGNLAWALDPDGAVTRRLGLHDLNQAVIFDREGEVAFQGYPPSDADALQRLVAPLIASAP